MPRRVQFQLPKLKIEMDRLLNQDIIERIEDTIEWVSNIVGVPKPNDEIRLCGASTQLNKAVIRPMPRIELSLAEIKEAKIFSESVADMGFCQIKLTPESQFLTCFLRPFGRFILYFVSKFNKVVDGIGNCTLHVDDILISGRNHEGRDRTEKV